MAEGKTVNAVFLNFSKVFVPHIILLDKLSKHDELVHNALGEELAEAQ